MPDYCKNCGAKITENTLTCPDCGKPIERKNTCPKCGGQVLNGNYCANCGCNIKETKIPKKRNNTLIILIAVAVVLAVIGAALFFQVELVESQEVQVDTINFSIPASLSVPASIPSGLSVTFLRTSTGFPNDGTSSCNPPESVITR